MTRTQRAALLFTLLGATACGGPNESGVQEAFQLENPHAVVRDTYVSEGDGSAVYFTIKYQDNLSKQEHRACWQYLNDGTNGWKLNHKGSILEPAPPGYCQ